MKWLLFAIGIVTEVFATICMKLSCGFSKTIPSILTFVFWGLSFTVFIYALKKFELSFAYALWAGLGILIVSIIGMLYFNESVNLIKIISIVLIVLGVIGLNISSS